MHRLNRCHRHNYIAPDIERLGVFWQNTVIDPSLTLHVKGTTSIHNGYFYGVNGTKEAPSFCQRRKNKANK